MTQESAINELLALHFGFSAFRKGQDEAVKGVLSGRDTLVIMPTGGGKSLCFQLPALLMDGVTVVVSPLIALMKDQVDGLLKKGIPASFINSSIAREQVTARLEEAKSGAVKLLYVAPERFNSTEFCEMIKTIKVSLLAIDEAHCISEWGHDFRPSYLRLKQAAQLIGRPPVIALTATATPEVREDILRQLDMNDPVRIITGFARPNLQFGVVKAKVSEKIGRIKSAIRSVSGSGIVYAGTRAKADEIAKELSAEGETAIVYHAGMHPEERRIAQQSFMESRVRVIVATNAFGLGIDKPDIRFVIHTEMPGTIEAYYQEAGRAGRDGLPSLCLLLYHPRDRHLQEFFIKGDNPPLELIRNLYELLISGEADTALVTYNELKEMLGADVPEMAIGTSLRILEQAGAVKKYSERSGSGTFQLLKNTENIKSGFSSRSEKKRSLLDGLHGLYGSDLYQGVVFKAEEIALNLGVGKDAVMRLIHALKDSGDAEYKPPFRGTEVRILQRIDPEDLPLDEAILKEKARRAYGKLDRMEEYVYEFSCRHGSLLRYFGEITSRLCGRCDNCLGAERIERTDNISSGSAKVRSVRRRKDDIHELNIDRTYSAKAGFGTKLTQLETYELYLQGLGVEEIAKARDIKEQTVIGHFAYLIEKGKDIEIGRLLDNKIRIKIDKAIKEAGDQKLKPIKELLPEDISYEQIKIALACLKAGK